MNIQPDSEYMRVLWTMAEAKQSTDSLIIYREPTLLLQTRTLVLQYFALPHDNIKAVEVKILRNRMEVIVHRLDKTQSTLLMLDERPESLKHILGKRFSGFAYYPGRLLEHETIKRLVLPALLDKCVKIVT